MSAHRSIANHSTTPARKEPGRAGAGVSGPAQTGGSKPARAAIPEATCRISAEGAVVEADSAFAGMLGFTREELLEVNARDLYRDPVEWQKLVDRYRRDPRLERVSALQAELRRRDGRPVHALLNGRAVRDARGRLEGFEVVAEDCTEKRELAAKLLQAQKMEAMGRLAGGVAHDFNNLLTVIKGYSDLLMQEAAPGSPAWRAAQQINLAADRASFLTTELLAFSRQQVVQPRLLDLNRVVADTQKMLARLIGEDIELEARLSESPVMVELDPGQITQVLLNLAANSRDAMPRGGKLAIETSNFEVTETTGPSKATLPSGRYALLSVSDTGCGMEGEGTKSSLAAIQAIAKQSGGDVWVTSEKGRGTTFAVCFAGAEQSCRAEAPQEARKPVRSAPARILLVEDEARVRELIGALLRRQGHTVLEAADGREALEAAEHSETPVQLLMTDVVMPEMNGRDLAKNLLSINPNIKRLFMSGYTANVIAHHGVLDQGVHFIQKPFSMKDLAAKAREALDKE